MRRLHPLSAGLLTLSLGMALSCGRDPGERTLPVDLFRRLEAAPAIELAVDEHGLAAAAAGARERLAELGWTVEIAGDPASGELPRIRVGTFEAAWAKPVAQTLGWQLAGKQLDFAGRTFRAEDTLLLATLPDPERPGLPLTVVLAARPAALAFGLERVVPGWRASALVWTGGDLRLELPLDPRGRPRLDAALDVEPPWRSDLRSYQVTTDETARIHARTERGIPADHARRLVEGLGRVRQRVEQIAPPGGGNPRVTRVVFESSVDRLVGYPIATDLAFADPWPSRILALAGEGVPDASGVAGAKLWLVENWGWPASSWVAEGLACERADAYWEQPLEALGARLFAAGLVPTVRELVAPELARELSPHLRVPARGLLARYLLETRGASVLEGLWRGAESLALGEELEDGFRDFLEARPAARRRTGEREVPAVRGAAFTNVLEPRARAARGWGSAAARQSLRELSALGATGISLPCFYADRSDLGDGWPLARSSASGALDGDAALALVVAQARAEGLSVLLGFEYLSRPAGSWDGDLKRLDAQDWRAFFERYERALLHYSLLAELLQVDLLSIGSGMLKASTTGAAASPTEPADDASEDAAEGPGEPALRTLKREAWGRLIGLARALYDGPLTYSAAWPQAQRIDFWRELDAVAVALHGDLRSAALPDLAGESGEGADRRAGSELWPAERFARQLDRPLLVTGIGFRSTERAAAGVTDAGGEVDLEAQASLLRELGVTLAALEAKGQAPRALLLWKWSCEPAAGGAADVGYSPQGKPALSVLGSLFD